VEQGAIRRQGECVGWQVGPGGRGGDPAAAGQLQDEPWGVLPPEVVRHIGEGATNFTLVALEDTNPSPLEM
jgi:hypothetical protein